MTRYTGVGSKNSSYTGILEITQGKQEISGNYTIVNWYLYLKASGSYYSATGTTCKVTINGEIVLDDYQQRSVSNNTENLFASGSFKVPHNSDGTKTVSVSASIETTANYSYLPGKCEMSGNFPLTTIPRASSFGTITGNTIGNAITVNINRNSSSFTHIFWYRMSGQNDWTKVGENYGTSVSFTPPMSLCSVIPNADTGTLELCIRTMNGTTIIGEDVYKSIKVSVPSSVVPTIGGITVSEAVANVKSKAGVYVQGLSKLNIAINNPAGAYGSTIKSYLITFEGVNYAKQSTVSDYIKGSGQLKIKGTVTDSRGRAASKEMTINVVAYSAPKFANAPSATRQSTATNVAVVSSGSVSSIKNGTTEKNHLKLYVLYKLVSATSYPAISDTYKVLDTATLTFNNTSKVLTDIDTSKSYNIKVVIMDNFKETSWELTIGTEIIGYDFNRNGLGIGKYREKGALDVLGNAYFSGNIQAGKQIFATNASGENDSGINFKDGKLYLYGYGNSTNRGLYDSVYGHVLRVYDSYIKMKKLELDQLNVKGEIYGGTNGDKKVLYDADFDTKFANKVLWQGASYMNADQSITLSEAISKQKYGILLIWSHYTSSAQNYDWNTNLVSKHTVTTYPNQGYQFVVANDNNAVVTKYLYINDTQISGYRTNIDSASGRNMLVLRYVLGV